MRQAGTGDAIGIDRGREGDVARLYSIRPALTLRGRRFKGIRGWEGKPTHPPLTDFPIVCFALAAVFDVLSWAIGAGDGTTGLARDLYRAASFVLIAGVIVAVPTALTGLWDWWRGLERDRSTGIIGRARRTQVWRTANWHMTIMLTVTALAIANNLTRLALSDEPSTPIGVALLSVLAGALVAFGALYGGALVYDYQFNVEPLGGRGVWDESEVDELPGQHRQT
jgi:uncharacterized membrane protein